MNTANNQLHQNTERRIREALLDFIDQGREPSVRELCEKSKINRATFYRHYLDIYDLMEQTERDIQRGLVTRLRERGVISFSAPFQREALLPMVEYIGEYRRFYRIYLEKHISHSLEESLRSVWETSLKPYFLENGVTDERRMLYYYCFINAGMTAVLKAWLEDNCSDPPEEIAEILINVLQINRKKGERNA